MEPHRPATLTPDVIDVDARPTAGVSSARLSSAPPEVPTPMTARPWAGFLGGLRAPKEAPTALDDAPWRRAARVRRAVLASTVVASTVLATVLLARTQPLVGSGVLHGLQVALFALLFGWVSAGFLTALMGFVVRLRGDRHTLSARDIDRSVPLQADARTALIMPICNEDVSTVFAGLRATVESLLVTGASHVFEVYVLSDTADEAKRAEEAAAHAELQALFAGRLPIHYRVRTQRGQKKAGNVADFCRRWGARHRYMVVLDADSVMSGDALVSLVRLMEAHPEAGILQTAPTPIGHDTLHARAQQFASRVVGPLFTAGMQYWQLGEAHYWGHNAIIRIEPFMRHCALAPVTGRGVLAGDILSHDFVEAALMRRAGYGVWLVGDLEGSFEQPPPDLVSELQRDRRWCQGNLQNFQLITEPGLHRVHRAMLFTGAMAYVSAPLWLAYLALGVVLWLTADAPVLPHQLGGAATALWAGTLAMLLLPRVLGVLSVALRGQAHRFGGLPRLAAGAVLEALLSALQAPLRMLAHSVFVVGALTGWKLEWTSPPRSASVLPWGVALRRFAPATVLAATVLSGLALAGSDALVWLLPVALPLLGSVPLAVWTSAESLGRALRDAGLLLVPEEHRVPAVLHRASRLALA
jgi:membrane glycosyltransferase